MPAHTHMLESYNNPHLDCVTQRNVLNLEFFLNTTKEMNKYLCFLQTATNLDKLIRIKKHKRKVFCSIVTIHIMENYMTKNNKKLFVLKYKHNKIPQEDK